MTPLYLSLGGKILQWGLKHFDHHQTPTHPPPTPTPLARFGIPVFLLKYSDKILQLPFHLSTHIISGGTIYSRAVNEYSSLDRESIFASTRVHFKSSVTREVLYYRPRNETLV